jgi:hypothetical protein
LLSNKEIALPLDGKLSGVFVVENRFVSLRIFLELTEKRWVSKCRCSTVLFTGAALTAASSWAEKPFRLLPNPNFTESTVAH